jgi:hypothetical protein
VCSSATSVSTPTFGAAHAASAATSPGAFVPILDDRKEMLGGEPEEHAGDARRSCSEYRAPVWTEPG